MQAQNSSVLHRVRAVMQRKGSLLLPFLALTPTLFCEPLASASEPKAQVSVPVQPVPITSRATPVSDEKNPVVRLQASDLRRFDEAFTALSEQGKIAFVAEDKPFVSTLSDDDLDKLTKSLPVGEASTLRAVTDAVAHAYDYDVIRTQTQPALVLLVKRYSNPKDFPQISYEEAERSLHNILLATNALNLRGPSDGRPGSFFNRLYQSMSAEQRAKMTKPVAVSDLYPEQRQLVYQLAYQNYFEEMDIFDIVHRRLKGLEDPRTEFCWMDWAVWMNSDVPLFVFGWEGPFGPNHGNQKVVLSHLSIGPGGAIGFAIPQAAAIASGLLDAKTGRLIKPLPDNGTEPSPADVANATLKQTAVEPDPNTPTLREAVERLNEAAASAPPKPGEDVFRATVDDALARKTVTLIGTKNLLPFNLLDAFSRVYGLWIVAQKEKSFLLTLRAPHPCKQAADVPQEIGRLFPEPMWRAMKSGSRNFENTDEEKAVTKRDEDFKKRMEKVESQLSEADKKGIKSQLELRANQAQTRMRLHAAEAMNVEAIRRIRALVEPLVPKNSGKRLPAVAVSEQAHDALAIFHLTQAVQSLDELMTRPVPPFLLHFDRATIQVVIGTMYGPNRAAYDIGYFDEKGIPRPGTSSYFDMKQ